MDQLKSMEVFIQVVDKGSFTRAADAMQMSPAMTSNHIAALEELVGVRLLDRTPKSLKLTEEGRVFYAKVQLILSDITEAMSIAKGSQAAPSGLLRVDAHVSLADQLIIPVLPEFFSRYPDVRVEISHTTHIFDVAHETFDVIFRRGPIRIPNLISKKLSDTLKVTAASPGYLSRFGEPKHPEDLLQHQCIGFVDPISGLNVDWKFERDGQCLALQPMSRLAFNQGASRIAAAIQGLGVIQSANNVLISALGQGQLKVILKEWAMPDTPMTVSYPKARYTPGKIRAFVEFMTEKYPPDRQMLH